MVRTVSVGLLVACFLLGAPLAPLAAQADESQTLAAFDRAFKKVRKGKQPDQESRMAALASLADLDSQKAAKSLVKAHENVAAEHAALAAHRDELHEKLANLSKGAEYSGVRTSGFRAVEREAAAVRQQIDRYREVLVAVRARIGVLRDEAAVAWMVKTVCGSRKHSLDLKIQVARTAGAVGSGLLPAMRAAITRRTPPEELAALVDGIGILGRAAQPAVADLIALLSHETALVREHTALALSNICDPTAIEPMIELLARSYGQSRKRIAAYLETLTRQQHGLSAPTWRRWWAQEKARYLAGSMPLGGGEPSHKKETKKRYASYFGIPQDGESIVYIIDSSGSMKKMITMRLPRRDPPAGEKGGRTKARMRGEKAGDTGADKRRSTRLEACKAELIRALGLLEPTTQFNVIWFNDMPRQWESKMQYADPATVKRAQDWVRKLQPNSSTNIYDSLHMAFQLTGLRAKKRGPTTGRRKKAVVKPDTIFLLTDGSPTIPPGNKLDSTEKIIKAVREWNKLRNVVIHTIGIGGELNSAFLQRLARENGGEFRRY